jgi:hypothetical protein
VGTSKVLVVSVSLTPSFSGNVLANAAASVTNTSSPVAVGAACQLFDGSKAISSLYEQSVTTGGAATVAPTGGEAVSAGHTANISLQCFVSAGSASVNANLNVLASKPG